MTNLKLHILNGLLSLFKIELIQITATVKSLILLKMGKKGIRVIKFGAAMLNYDEQLKEIIIFYNLNQL